MSTSSDDLQTTGLYNVGDDEAVKKQDDTLTLRFIEKRNRNITGEKTINYCKQPS